MYHVRCENKRHNHTDLNMRVIHAHSYSSRHEGAAPLPHVKCRNKTLSLSSKCGKTIVLHHPKFEPKHTRVVCHSALDANFLDKMHRCGSGAAASCWMWRQETHSFVSCIIASHRLWRQNTCIDAIVMVTLLCHDECVDEHLYCNHTTASHWMRGESTHLCVDCFAVTLNERIKRVAAGGGVLNVRPKHTSVAAMLQCHSKHEDKTHVAVALLHYVW